MNKSEIRKDYLFNRYVLIAHKRGARPHDFTTQSVDLKQPSRLAPDQIKKNKIRVIDTIGKGAQQVRSVDNPFPAVTISNSKARGRQEVIIETPDPSKQLFDLGVQGIKRMLQMYARRTKALAREKNLNYILCFKNEGPKSGASLLHAHSQVFASEFIPPLMHKESMLLAQYEEESGGSFYGDLIDKEMKSARRIFKDAHVAVFAPYASAFPHEAWIFSRQKRNNIFELSETDLFSFARALYGLLKKIRSLGLSYNLTCHYVRGDGRDHFYMKLQPRDNIWAGVEMDSGLIINSVAPEEAAKMYRKAFKIG